MNERLRDTLRELRLSGLAASLEVRLEEAMSRKLTHTEFLELIFQDELAVRADRMLTRRVKAAEFRDLKTLDHFDFGFNPTIDKRQIYELASREVKRARQYFRAAIRRHLIDENPFPDVTGGKQTNKSREFFVTREVTQQVIDACPDYEWRLIVALSRYGGLRCPSEHLGLRLDDIDWARDRMTVRSPKTEHHEGGESRVVPIFPELLPYLREACERAEPGTEYVITRYRDKNANLRTQFERIIRRAGLAPWPKLFQNLRASRETELSAEYPLHVVCKWIGNSPAVAQAHYLQVTEADYRRAAETKRGILEVRRGAESGALSLSQTAQDEAQPVTATNRHVDEKSRKPCDIQDLRPTPASCGQFWRVGLAPPRGVEPLFSD